MIDQDSRVALMRLATRIRRDIHEPDKLLGAVAAAERSLLSTLTNDERLLIEDDSYDNYRALLAGGYSLHEAVNRALRGEGP